MRHLLLTTAHIIPATGYECRMWIKDITNILDVEPEPNATIYRCVRKYDEGWTCSWALNHTSINIHMWDNGLGQIDVFSVKNFKEDDVIRLFTTDNIKIVHKQLLFR